MDAGSTVAWTINHVVINSRPLQCPVKSSKVINLMWKPITLNAGYIKCAV